MRSIIERGEGQWVLRFLAPRRDDVKRLQTNVTKATTLFLSLNGFQNVLRFVKLFPQGSIHNHDGEWALTFKAHSRRDARQMKKAILKLEELLWWDSDHPRCRRDWTEEQVTEHEERCPEFDDVFC